MTKRESRNITLSSATEDEAISVGIVFFDKFANFIGDLVIVAIESGYGYSHTIRKIELKEGLKVEITVL
jgi:hypothetical protein